jgi:small subunit ribosomal protein S4
MARYRGPTCRVARRYSKDLEFKQRPAESKCKFSTPPGQHGGRRKRDTDYGVQLAAKQMLKGKYGLLEKPFRRFYREAARRKGPTGVLLLQLLESRLDNIVFRMGFASTRREARQLVVHGAIQVNGRMMDIPSFILSSGDNISIREGARSQVRIQEAIQNVERKEMGVPEWVIVDFKKMHGVYTRIPDRDDLPSDINEQLVVELYSKS